MALQLGLCGFMDVDQHRPSTERPQGPAPASIRIGIGLPYFTLVSSTAAQTEVEHTPSYDLVRPPADYLNIGSRGWAMTWLYCSYAYELIENTCCVEREREALFV